MKILRDEELKITLYERADFNTPLISHYALTGKRIFRKDAVKQAKYILSKYLTQTEVTNALAESAIEQWLFKQSNVPFKGPEEGQEKFTFIDLFAGIGGFRMAMQNLGGKCVFSSEWDKQAQFTYKMNYGEIPFGDITSSEVKKFIPASFDVLCAGFPCQPFSKAGVSARNFLGLEHGFDHPTQGNLFFEIMRIAQRHRPKVLFLENVKNLKSHDGGNTFNIIKEMVEEIGYSFNSSILNSVTEVPQRRERTYMVCFRNQKSFTFPELKGDIKKLGDYLEADVPEIYTISNALWEGHIKRSARNKARGTGFTVKLADLNKPSNTIVARYYKDGKECLVPQDGRNPRMLTLRECARLQGFPEEFLYHPSKIAGYKQFGNSVAVPVIERIAKKILESLSIKKSNETHGV